jgi:hypothetical protein
MSVVLFGQNLTVSLAAWHSHQCRLSLVAVLSLEVLYLFLMPAM